MLRFILPLLILPFVTSSAFADDQCDIHYRVTPQYDSSPRRLDVVVTFPAEGKRESWLRMQPEWAGVKDFSAFLTPSTEQGRGVKVEGTPEPYRWKVEHAPEGSVRVSYQVRAALPDPDDEKVQQQDDLYRTQIGNNWFQFFGYGVFPSVEAWDDARSGRMCVTLVQPADRSGPLLGSYFNGTTQAQAVATLTGSHAVLRHAFYAGGPGWRVVPRTVAGGPVITASRGRLGLDDSSFADRVSGLLETHRRFWGEAQSTQQTVVRTPNNSVANYGGTLVRQAAVLHVGKDFGPNSESFEFLIGHENLHQWLPHRLGGPETGGAEQVARHYWLSEGFTDYYAHRLLLADGLWTLDRYAAQLTRMLRTYWRSPARQAPADKIAPRFFSDRDTGRQMYARGELLAMAWDRELRLKDAAGLDGVLRSLILSQAEATQAPPARERVLAALSERLGPGPRQQVLTVIDEGRSFDLEEGLAGPCFTLGWDAVPRWVPGFDVKSMSSPTRQATGVVVDGPAYRAGLRDGMTLQGWSIYGGDTSKEILLKVKTEEGSQDLRYWPVDGSTERLPTLTVRAGAKIDTACLGWIRR
jgi:predicted metalloprotease with PDZ domain